MTESTQLIIRWCINLNIAVVTMMQGEDVQKNKNVLFKHNKNFNNFPAIFCFNSGNKIILVYETGKEDCKIPKSRFKISSTFMIFYHCSNATPLDWPTPTPSPWETVTMSVFLTSNVAKLELYFFTTLDTIYSHRTGYPSLRPKRYTVSCYNQFTSYTAQSILHDFVKYWIVSIS